VSIETLESHMTVTKFDRENATAVQADILAALQEVAQKHGLMFINSGGSIGTTECTFKIKAVVKDQKAAKDSAKEEFENYANIIGYKKEWFGKSFRQGNTIYTITGVAPTRDATPIKAKNPKGKEYLFRLYDVASQFGDKSVPMPMPTMAQEAAAERRAMKRMARYER
jgi:hypothetical protein